jgi:DNA-binding beta-propeller fold protein YncE
MNTFTSSCRRRRPVVRGICTGLAVTINCTAGFAAGPYAYVPSNFHDTVSVVDLADTNAPPGTFTGLVGDPAQGNPGFFGVALSQADGMLYLSADYDNVVYQIDVATGTTTHRYEAGVNPRGIAVDASGRHVYVANFSSASISIIDTMTQLVRNVDFDLSGLANPSPIGVAVNLSGTRAYVTDTSVGHRLCRINVTTPPDHVTDADCVEVGANDSANPTAVALSPDGSRAFVSIHGNGSSVAVVDTASMTVMRTFPLNYASPNGIVVNASGKRGYVGTTGGKILSLDLSRVDDPGQNPVIHVLEDAAVGSVQGVAISQDGTRLLAVDNAVSALHLIDIDGDADTLVASVSVNQGPFALGQFTPRDSIFVSGFEKAG